MTRRGAERRDVLLASAAELLQTQGFDAVRHRGVAERAGVPLAATTYYFASRRELVTDALDRVATEALSRSRALVQALDEEELTADATAAVLVRTVTAGADPGDHAALLAFYERLVQAGRHPWLQPHVRRWNAELVELLASALRRCGQPNDRDLARVVLAVVDGLLLDALVEGDPDPAAAAQAGVTRVLAPPLVIR